MEFLFYLSISKKKKIWSYGYNKGIRDRIESYEAHIKF